jgi:Tfp pilus assembly protein PilF
VGIRLTSVWVALIIILGCVVIIYSNIYQCPFVFDDIPGIKENAELRDLSNNLSFGSLLKPREIVDFTFALNYKFGKLNVFGYHLINVLIHIINGFLAYFLAHTIFRQLSKSPVPQDPHFGEEKSTAQSPPSKVQSSRLGSYQSPIANCQSPIQLMSLFTALIFVAHPIQTQAVTYTVQRCTSMAALFFLASVLFYLKARLIQQGAEERGRRSEVRGQREESEGRKKIKASCNRIIAAYFAISIICGMLAFLSKQNTASLPGVILIAEYLLMDRTWKGWKRRIPWFLLMLTLWGLFVLYIVGFFSGGIEGRGFLEDVSAFTQETEHVSRWSYLCTQFNVLVIYIRLLFFPLGQNVDHFYPFMGGFFDGYTFLAFLFLIGTMVLGIWNLKKRPLVSLGIFWFFITLSVESSIIPISDAMFEHRLYLPMFGFALITSYLVFCFLSRRILWAVVGCAVVVICLGVAAYVRNAVWQDHSKLWSDVVAKNPLNPRAHYNLGIALEKKGFLDKAISEYSIAVRISPEYADAHNNLGNVLARKGREKAAIGHYLKAIRINPKLAKAHYNLGLSLVEKGDLKGAISHYSEAISVDPGYADAHYNLGLVLYRCGDLDGAINHFSKSLQIKPGLADVHNNLGTALARKGRLKEAAAHYAEALNINPGFGDARNNLNIITRRMREMGDPAFK